MVTIVRNFQQRKVLPSRPTRVWRNRIGPRSCFHTRKAANAKTGAKSSSRPRVPTMSKVRLARRTASAERGFSRWISGRPPTGRTLIRSLETSVTLGAITTAMSSCSRSQASRRISAAESNAPPARKTTSAPASMATSATEREEPSSGYARGRGRTLARLRGERADHVVAEPRLAAQHSRDLVDVTLVARDHDAVLQGAHGPGAVDAAAEQESTQRPGQGCRSGRPGRRSRGRAGSWSRKQPMPTAAAVRSEALTRLLYSSKPAPKTCGR